MKKIQTDEWIPVTFKVSERDYTRLLEACTISNMTRSEICRIIIINNLAEFMNEYDHNGLRREINQALNDRRTLENFLGDMVSIVYQRDTGIPECLHLVERAIEEGKFNRRIIEEIIGYTNSKMTYIEKYLPDDAKMLADFLIKVTKISSIDYEQTTRNGEFLGNDILCSFDDERLEGDKHV